MRNHVAYILVKHHSRVHCRRTPPFDASACEGCSFGTPVAKAEAHAARFILEFFIHFLFYFVYNFVPLRRSLNRIDFKHTSQTVPAVKGNLACRVICYPCKLVDPPVHLTEVILIKILLDILVVSVFHI